MTARFVPTAPAPAPVPAPVASPPAESPQVGFDPLIKSVRILPLGSAKPPHASVYCEALGAIAPRARAICEAHPALAEVRKLQAELAAAKEPLTRAVQHGGAVGSEYMTLKGDALPMHAQRLDALQRGAEAAAEVVSVEIANVRAIEARVGLQMSQAREELTAAARPALEQQRDALRAKSRELADRIAALIPPAVYNLAREMAVAEHALAELAPNAPLLDARVGQEIDGVVMQLLLAPA